MTHYTDDNNEYDLQQSWAEKPAIRFWNGRHWAYSYPRDPDYARRLADFEENGIEAYDD